MAIRTTRATLIAVPFAAALTLVGCGTYDGPADATNTQTAGPTEITTATADPGQDQRISDLIDDARALLATSDHVLQAPQAPGPIKALAGQVRGTVADQIGELGGHAGPGAGRFTDAEQSRIMETSGQESADLYNQALHTHLPRLQTEWAALKDSPDPHVADLGRRMEARIAEIVSQLR